MRQAAMRTVTTEEGTRRLLQTAAATAERAGAYVQAAMSRLGEPAQELTRDAGHRMAEYTRAVGGWTREAQDFMRRHPLQVLAGALVLGYVAGKLRWRRE
jgi:ElaB/YqjD/DUF883 family membrane-anchored ribosome-binding protein